MIDISSKWLALNIDLYRSKYGIVASPGRLATLILSSQLYLPSSNYFLTFFNRLMFIFF